MAVLTLENGKKISDRNEIEGELESLGIRLNHWPVGDSGDFKSMLKKPQLDDEEKDSVLTQLDHYFEELKTTQNYQSRDLIVLHAQTPGIEDLLKKFDRCHTHDDDEVRYIIDGEGVFGFVRPDGSQVSLLVEAEEYINVPKDTEHWFLLTEKRQIKAVRYFSDTAGWTPVYTDTAQRV